MHNNNSYIHIHLELQTDWELKSNTGMQEGNINFNHKNKLEVRFNRVRILEATSRIEYPPNGEA